MDRVGALADDDGAVVGQDGLYVAGEMAADVPHAWLAVLESGARAGYAACFRSEGRVATPAGASVQA
jgi:hypothetical protein